MRLFLISFICTAVFSCQNEKKQESNREQTEKIVPEKKLAKSKNSNAKLELENEIF